MVGGDVDVDVDMDMDMDVDVDVEVCLDVVKMTSSSTPALPYLWVRTRPGRPPSRRARWRR